MNSANWVQSPFNYTGGKYKLLPQILPLFPESIDTLVDIFCGGGNVGINTIAKNVVLNDNNKNIISLLEIFKKYTSKEIIHKIEEIIIQYNLSDSGKKGYEYYNCNSLDGLGKYNKEYFLLLRNDFNRLAIKDDYYYFMLFVLIIFSFNNQIRFNKVGKFNLPVGKRDFNEKMKEKVIKFSTKIKSNDIYCTNNSFCELKIENLSERSLIYADPPYLITCASYNEQDGWNDFLEKKLLDFLDNANYLKIKFALSNVLSNGEQENTILKNWITKNPNYVLHNLNYNYANSSYQKKNRNKQASEVLITNYSV